MPVIGLILGVLTLIAATVSTVIGVGLVNTAIESSSSSSSSRASASSASSASATSPSSPRSSGASSSGSDTAEGRDVGAMGDTASITGRGQEFEIIAKRVIDPAQAEGDIFTPDPGKRYVAVEVTVNNVGSAEVTVSPLFNFTMYDTAGADYNASLFASLSDGELLEGGTLQPGESQSGLVVFELDGTATPKSFAFEELGSGPVFTWNI